MAEQVEKVKKARSRMGRRGRQRRRARTDEYSLGSTSARRDQVLSGKGGLATTQSDDVVEGPQLLAVEKARLHQCALAAGSDICCRKIVQDHVHAGQAGGGAVFLLSPVLRA